jgi:hypothetical protein
MKATQSASSVFQIERPVEFVAAISMSSPAPKQNNSAGGVSPVSFHSHGADTNASKTQDLERQSRAITDELEKINARRRELELQRHLLEQSPRSRSQSVHGRVETHHDPLGATHIQPIPSERRRTQTMHYTQTPQHTMKETMKQSWEQDSTLVGGCFQYRLTKAGTFGRATRFAKPVGMKGYYYLSADMQAMQSAPVRLSNKRHQVATRGQRGSNINPNWNSVAGGTAPGPGAYTPRFSGVL